MTWQRHPSEVRQPNIDCPGCGAYVYLNESYCWRCFRVFHEAELRDRWERAQGDC